MLYEGILTSLFTGLFRHCQLQKLYVNEKWKDDYG
jgi:hypothetical protein